MNIAKIIIPRDCAAILYERSAIRQGLEVPVHFYDTAIPVWDAPEYYAGGVMKEDFLRQILKTGRADRDILRRGFYPALSVEAESDTVADVPLR